MVSGGRRVNPDCFECTVINLDNSRDHFSIFGHRRFGGGGSWVLQSWDNSLKWIFGAKEKWARPGGKFPFAPPLCSSFFLSHSPLLVYCRCTSCFLRVLLSSCPFLYSCSFFFSLSVLFAFTKQAPPLFVWEMLALIFHIYLRCPISLSLFLYLSFNLSLYLSHVHIFPAWPNYK